MHYLGTPYVKGGNQSELYRVKEGSTLKSGQLCIIDTNGEIDKYQGTGQIFGVAGIFEQGYFDVIKQSFQLGVELDVAGGSVEIGDVVYVSPVGNFTKATSTLTTQGYIVLEANKMFKRLLSDGTNEEVNGVFIDYNVSVVAITPTVAKEEQKQAQEEAKQAQEEQKQAQQPQQKNKDK